MKQLVARIPEDVHARLERRAQNEGRSLDALVNEVLGEAVPAPLTPMEELRERIRAAGLEVKVLRPDGPVPSLDEAIALTRGWGTAVSEALLEERRRR